MNMLRVVAPAADTILEHMATLADPLRARMLRVLEGHELTVSEICSILQLPQSTVSRHLKTLLDGGWVSSRREATSRYYGMDPHALDAGASRLWPLTREHLASTSSADRDTRRLAAVLARRRSRSEEFFSAASGQWDRLRRDLFGATFHLHALLSLLDPTLVVGDLGCGTGQLTATLAPHVARVIGVDGSPEMLQTARRRLASASNVDLRRGDLEALPLHDAELDCAVLALVLHHVADPARALAEVARTLKPQGTLLVLDMLPHDRAEYQQQMGHVWLGFPESQMRKMLAASGFDAVRIHTLPVDPEATGPGLFAAVGRGTARPA
ncbi:MAG: metalloregulator ArsR/SmtB family transcription factor [Acidobacteria bacterium]|nr:metalloregulator ArsR/SmtB family transcription factor [Acidobacteriota bacterium]